MPKYFLSPLAQKDIIAIRKYTNKHWGREQTKIYTQRLRERMLLLAENPQLGISRDNVKKGYRSFPEGKHVIFYRCTKQKLEIIAVPHQSEDITTHFDK